MGISSEQFRQMQARVGASFGPIKSSEAAESEAQLQDDIEAACRSRGWVVFRSRMDRRTTRPLGEPDLAILADGGRTIWVEAKSRAGKVRPEQAALHAAARKLGHVVHIVRSLKEFHAIATNRQTDP